jgi:hypothetical protein
MALNRATEGAGTILWNEEATHTFCASKARKLHRGKV